jgi:uncharacterized membrane protein
VPSAPTPQMIIHHQSVVLLPVYGYEGLSYEGTHLHTSWVPLSLSIAVSSLGIWTVEG